MKTHAMALLSGLALATGLSSTALANAILLSDGRYISGGGREYDYREPDHTGMPHLLTPACSQQRQQQQWVALVCDTAGGKVHIYLNGQSQGVFNYVKPLYAQTEPLCLGVSFPGGLEVFRGVLDDVRIYRRALNADEISALYGAGL